MLYTLVLITLGFMILNFILTDNDYLSPATLFCEIFFIYELICVIGQSTYSIKLHAETVLVLMCSFVVFTIFSLISNKISKKTTQKYELKIIRIPKLYLYGLIVMQILTILFFIKYLRAIAVAWGSGSNSIRDMINLYDTMTKFWTNIFAGLNVPVPMIYRICNPIVYAAAYLVLYVMVNNFIVNKKIHILHLIIIFLQCCLIILNGSRSPLLRLVTMIIILVYVFSYRKYGKRKGSLKFFFQLIGVVVFLAVFMIGILYVMGRTKKIENLAYYFFVYTGAPIVNLDTYLSHGVNFFTGSSELFGAQTFKGFYAYLGKIFKIDSFSYNGIGAFAFSPNGIEIGNVYTTFYNFIYDFGYIGVLPLTGIVAWYYTSTYRKLLKYHPIKIIDYRLFIYSYLFNDLIMLAFSNRFFETVLNASFLKFLLMSWILDKIIFEHKLRIEKAKIKFVSY